MFADNDKIILEFLRQCESQLSASTIQRVVATELDTITVQVDTRPPGILNSQNLGDPLNRSAKFMYRHDAQARGRAKSRPYPILPEFCYAAI